MTTFLNNSWSENEGLYSSAAVYRLSTLSKPSMIELEQDLQTKFPNKSPKLDYQMKFPNKISKLNFQKKFQMKFPNKIVWHF